MHASSKAGKKDVNGPKDDDNDLVDPFAGLAEGYDGDDELMLEALGMKPAPKAPPRTTPPAAAPTQSPPGAMPPDVLNAILAAIPDAVRSAINEKDVSAAPTKPRSGTRKIRLNIAKAPAAIKPAAPNANCPV